MTSQSDRTTQEQNGASEPSVPLVPHSSQPPTPPEPPEENHLSLPGNINPVVAWSIVASIALAVGWIFNNPWFGLVGAVTMLLLALRELSPAFGRWYVRVMTPPVRQQVLGWMALAIALVGLGKFLGLYRAIGDWSERIKWDEFGSWADWVGAVGQISIAILAVYVAWRQYIISKDLTIQQNIITQQQTIDAYFQGISDLALSDEGLLEDWPQERAFAEGRTAAILNSVDARGKAKIIRFLSQSKLLTPLRRDDHLGRPILDGHGGYAEDRARGVRVIDLGVMLAGSDLSGADLRWSDLSEANFVRTHLRGCDLYRANLARTVLYEATLVGADLRNARLFYGNVQTASPRSRVVAPNYSTGEHTGAVVEKANFTNVIGLSDEQRYYCCAWCGERSRRTIPGGCEGIPNQLGR